MNVKIQSPSQIYEWCNTCLTSSLIFGFILEFFSFSSFFLSGC